MSTRAVGIKTLKAKLSQYVRLVKAGETILVTDRDEVVAELRPAHRQKIPPSNLDEALEQMAERGEVTLRSISLKDVPWPVKPVRLEGVDIQRILDEVREDR